MSDSVRYVIYAKLKNCYFAKIGLENKEIWTDKMRQRTLSVDKLRD